MRRDERENVKERENIKMSPGRNPVLNPVLNPIVKGLWEPVQERLAAVEGWQIDYTPWICVGGHWGPQVAVVRTKGSCFISCEECRTFVYFKAGQGSVLHERAVAAIAAIAMQGEDVVSRLHRSKYGAPEQRASQK